MHGSRHSQSGFTLLELLMAMALFAIAGVSLAQAINLISLTVVETIEEAEIRENVRSILLEKTRLPEIREGEQTLDDENGVTYRIKVERLILDSDEAIPLNGIFEVKVTATRNSGSGAAELIESAETWTYEELFR